MTMQLAEAQIEATSPGIELIKLGKGKVALKKFHENGQLAQTGWLKNNQPHGAWASFNEQGKKTAQAQYERGIKHGTWLFWDNSGHLLCEIEYHYGQIITARQYNLQGMVVAARGN